MTLWTVVGEFFAVAAIHAANGFGDMVIGVSNGYLGRMTTPGWAPFGTLWWNSRIGLSQSQ